MKTIVTLVSVADLGVLPSKIYGANGRALAYPRLDPVRRRHVVEMDYDEYLKVVRTSPPTQPDRLPSGSRSSGWKIVAG